MSNDTDDVRDEYAEFDVLPSLAVKPSDRTTSLSVLKTFSENHYVSYSTIVIGVALLVVALIIEVFMFVSTDDYTKWSWPALLLWPIAALGVVLLVMLPANSVQSKFTAAIDYFMSKLTRTSAIDAPLNAESVDDAVIHFNDGSVGAAFSVSGVLARSALSTVLRSSASARKSWLIRRPSTSTSALVVSLKPSDFTTQMNALDDVKRDDWSAAMAAKIKAYIKNTLHNKSRKIEQTLFIRERSVKLLERSIDDTVNALRGRTLMKCRRLHGDELASRIDDVTSSAITLSDSAPVWRLPSTVVADGRVLAVADLIQLPTAVALSVDDMVDLIPVPSNDVELRFVVSDALITDDDKSELIRKNATGGKQSVENDDYADATADILDEARQQLRGYATYERDIKTVDPLVMFKIRLVIIAKTPAIIDAEIADQNTLLAETVRGFRWELVSHDAANDITHLLDGVDLRKGVMTSTTSEYAKLELIASAGLDDDAGVPIGVESESITSSVAMIDWNASLTKQGIIAAPAASRAVSYDANSLSSVMAQSLANSVVMSGHAVQHLSLNGFTYDSDEYFRPDGGRQIIDVAASTVNPLQGFGPIEDVVAIFSRLVDRLTAMFDVLTDLKMTMEDKSIVKESIRAFYYNHSLWHANAATKPKTTRITAISNPETYPTMTSLLNELSSIAKSAAVNNREMKADRVDALEALLRQALTTYMNVLGKTTNIDEPTMPQTYYDFSGIASETVKQIQFMNIVDYCLAYARSGDVIVIHGFERVSPSVLTAVVPSLLAAHARGIRTVFAYDLVTAPTGSELAPLAVKSDFSTLNGLMYSDMDFDVDFSLIGKCLSHDVAVVESCLNTQLSAAIKHGLTSKSKTSLLVHRRAGGVNVFVSCNPLI